MADCVVARKGSAPEGTATKNDVLSGKTFQSANSDDLQTGTMPIRANGTNTAGSGKDNSGIWFWIPYGYYPEYSNGRAWVASDPSQYGNASASDVFNGKTFTSSAGLKISGTYNPQISLMFSDGHIEYFSKDKFKTGSTTTRPFIPITINVSTNKSFGNDGGKGSSVSFNGKTILDNSNRLGSTSGSTGASSRNIYLPLFCSNVDNLKKASFSQWAADGGASYSVTYTSWIEA